MGRRDQIDLLCEQWARTRRELMGLRSPLTAAGYLGMPRCTLGQRRDLHAGSRSLGRVEQHFPEVYCGDAYLVNVAYKRMPEPLQLIMDVHYVIERPRDKRVRAELLGIKPRSYWDRLRVAKSFIQGSLSISESVRTQRADFGGRKGIPASAGMAGDDS